MYTLNQLEAFLTKNTHVKIEATTGGYYVRIADVFKQKYNSLCEAFHAAQLLA